MNQARRVCQARAKDCEISTHHRRERRHTDRRSAWCVGARENTCPENNTLPASLTHPTICLLLLLCGCHTDMCDQPRYEPLEASALFSDGQSARPVVEGTVARGQLNEDDAFFRGKVEGEFVAQVPLALDRALLERGQERFNIYCSLCHGPTGDGDGMIVRRGMKRPPSFHTDRLRAERAGHFFDVITHGFGVMPRYAVQIEPRDRWAITAYVRVLQRSQNASLDDVPAAERTKLEETP